MSSTAVRDEFDSLAQQNWGLVRAHCYRMLGSIHDAEDATQEAMISAWQAFDTFEGRSSFSTWLYRIATNVCLMRMRERSRASTVPGHDGDRVAPDGDVPWLTPLPSALAAADASTAAEESESIHLAFVAALQLLPARQRACVILKDVLDWSSAEIAAALDTTPAAVNSALQRGRATLAESRRPPLATAETERLARRWLELWERADVTGLANLLAEDAIMSMPPIVFRGRDTVLEFLARGLTPDPATSFRLVSTSVNGGPAFAAYLPEPGVGHRAYAILVPESAGDRIARITGFQDPRLLPIAGMPETLPPPTSVG